MATKPNRAESGSYGDKKALNRAFAALRKAGYFARQNFWCCSTCGWSDVPEGTEKAVFYHSQDAESLKEEKSCYLSWRGDGHEIVRILRENHIDAEWNGEQNTRILVTLAS